MRSDNPATARGLCDRLIDDLFALIERVAALEDLTLLDARIREGAKDSIRGLAFLVVGLLCLLTANIIGVL